MAVCHGREEAMTYEELVLRVRDVYENADAREVFEHIAVQVNVEGEAAGAFYLEVADRQVCVEPYDYYDRDILVTVDTRVLLDLLDNRLGYREAIDNGMLRIEGNIVKFGLLSKIKIQNKKIE